MFHQISKPKINQKIMCRHILFICILILLKYLFFFIYKTLFLANPFFLNLTAPTRVLSQLWKKNTEKLFTALNLKQVFVLGDFRKLIVSTDGR